MTDPLSSAMDAYVHLRGDPADHVTITVHDGKAYLRITEFLTVLVDGVGETECLDQLASLAQAILTQAAQVILTQADRATHLLEKAEL